MSKPVICIGASLVDELMHLSSEILLATTNEATVSKTPGGVGRNIAHQLAILGVPVQLISVFGNDSDGDWLKEGCKKAHVKTDASITIDGSTGKYTGILKEDGSLYSAFLLNPALHMITPQHLEKNKELLATASYLLADANLEKNTFQWLVDFSKASGVPLILEPVSVPPASKFRDVDMDGLYMITPNEDELPVLCQKPAFFTQQQIEELLGRGIKNIWLHNGKYGSALYNSEKAITLHAPTIEVKDCTGAGDGSLSGFIFGKHHGREDLECLKLAHTLSAEILQVNGAIARHLDEEKLLSLVSKYYPE
jgi:pseudouridine kinase